MRYKNYVGVFDSGVGGISVLQELRKELPHEDFYYFGDSANAPYGEKSPRVIRKLAMAIADHMVEEGCKAIVIACNTATSAAAPKIRAKYDANIPILGMEPALKPAAKQLPHGKVLVMATPATLKLEKYQKLSHRLEGEAEFIPVLCKGLAGRVEQGDLDAPDMLELLDSLIGPYRGQVDGIVLGCTHYPFLKRQIRTVMGENIPPSHRKTARRDTSSWTPVSARRRRKSSMRPFSTRPLPTDVQAFRYALTSKCSKSGIKLSDAASSSWTKACSTPRFSA